MPSGNSPTPLLPGGCANPYRHCLHACEACETCEPCFAMSREYKMHACEACRRAFYYEIQEPASFRQALASSRKVLQDTMEQTEAMV